MSEVPKAKGVWETVAEFFLQGDVERVRGKTVTSTCDRTSQSRVALQRGPLPARERVYACATAISSIFQTRITFLLPDQHTFLLPNLNDPPEVCAFPLQRR